MHDLVSCAVEITKESPEFTEGRQGYLKALTALAVRNRRAFVQKGGGRRFMLELAEGLPEDVRPFAVQYVESLKIKDFDSDNADKNVSAGRRLLNAFRGICVAWNLSSKARDSGKHVTLDGLYKLEGALAALAAMELEAQLVEHASEPTLNLFQDRVLGGLYELQYWANWSGLPFARNAQAVMRRLLAGVPTEISDVDKIRILAEVDAIRSDDGHNAFRQDDAARRILTAWSSISSYYPISGACPSTKEGTRRLMIAMKGQVLLASELTWFRKPDGAMPYFRDFARMEIGSFGSDDTTRDFLIRVCREKLPEPESSEAQAAIMALEWKKNDGITAFTRGGGKASERMFNALSIIARAWNKAKKKQPELQIYVSRLHSAAELERALTLLGYSPPVPPVPMEIPPEQFVNPAAPPALTEIEETPADAVNEIAVAEESAPTVPVTEAEVPDDTELIPDPPEFVGPSRELPEVTAILVKLRSIPVTESTRQKGCHSRIRQLFHQNAPPDVVQLLWDFFHELEAHPGPNAYVRAAREDVLNAIFDIAHVECQKLSGVLKETFAHEDPNFRLAGINAMARRKIKNGYLIFLLEELAATDPAHAFRAKQAVEACNR